jgi:hypothetical protein
MALSDVLRRTGTVLAKNSPGILTGLAVAGTVATAYLTGRASFKAAQILDDHETRVIRDHEEPLTAKEKVYYTWKLFIPGTAVGTGTIAAIILANRIGARRAAALLAAYAISERAYEEYKDKIIEKIGERKESAYRDEIAQDRVTKYPPPSDLLWDEETNSVLCCDLFTGRYFFSDMESLRRAENDINYMINSSYYASLTDFYERVGLEKTSMSDDFGWNADKLLELHFATALTPGGRPCLTFNFRVMPIRGYARVQ